MNLNNYDEKTVRHIGKKLGVTGSDYVDSFAFRAKNGQPLTDQEKFATNNSNKIRWSLSSLVKMINEKLRSSGKFTLKEIRDSFPDPDTEIITSSGKGIRKMGESVLVNKPKQPPTLSNSKKKIVIDEGSLTGGLWDKGESLINNKIIPQVRQQQREGLWGIPPAASQFINDLIPESQDQDNWLTRLWNNFNKGLHKNLFGTTAEDRFLQEITAQNPELKTQLKTNRRRAMLAGTVFYDPKSKQKFTFDENGNVVRV